MHRRDWTVFRHLLLAADDGAAGGAGAGATGAEAPGADAANAASPAASPATTGGDAPNVEGGSSSSQAAAPAVDMARLRDVVLKANPDVIPEMVAGTSFDELMSSVEPARAAYQRIVQSVQSSSPQPPAVPAGGGATRQFVVNIEELSPSAKIAEGLRQRNAKRS